MKYKNKKWNKIYSLDEVKWTKGCGKQHSLPEECAFCKRRFCFYMGICSDKQYP